MRIEWHGYQQADDADPERPWWRFYIPRDDANCFWVRADGRRLEIGSDSRAARLAFDRSVPMAYPPPKCGQVWVGEAEERMVTRVRVRGPRSWSIVFGGEDLIVGEDHPNVCVRWPLMGWDLVDGPGAPWSDTAGPLELLAKYGKKEATP